MANIIRYVLRGDTGENWQRVNPVLLYNEIGYDRTTKRFKMGDNVTPWKELPYVAPDEESWTFTFSDGSTTTKRIALWT